MAKVIKYGDTSAIESEFKQAPVGLYVGKVEEVNQKTSKNDEAMAEVVFVLTKDSNGKKLKERYGQLWYYAPLDPESSWARRLKELVTAFGLKAKGGNIATIEGKEALVRLREDTDLNGDYRPTIGKVMKMKEAEVEEDEEEDEADENGLADLSRAQLKKMIAENELDITVKKSMSDDDLRALIEEQMEPEDEEEEDEDIEDEEEEEEEEDEEEEAESDNYEEMSIKELRQELKDRALESTGKRAALIARLRTDDVEEPV